jgi:hypothetical protein
MTLGESSEVICGQILDGGGVDDAWCNHVVGDELAQYVSSVRVDLVVERGHVTTCWNEA